MTQDDGRQARRRRGAYYTAGEVALWNFAALAGLAPVDSNPSANVFTYVLEVLGHNADVREQGELGVRTVETVRGFLVRKGLLEDLGKVAVDEHGVFAVRGLSPQELAALERSGRGEAERATRSEAAPYSIQPGPLMPEMLDQAKELRAVSLTVDGEVRELLALDVLLAELLEELGQENAAAKVRATPAEGRGARWRYTVTEGGLDEPKACTAVVGAVWARIVAERARARKEAEEQEGRRRKVPVPSMHALTARVVTGLGRHLDTSELRGLAAGIVAPPEPGRWAQLSETAGDTAGVLAAWLATQAHGQWVSGGFDMADRVEVVASKEELVRMGLSSHEGSPVAVLEEALALLASTRLMGGADDKQPGSGRLVLDYFLAPKPKVSAKGGRPSAVYVVTVGWPLMPLRLEALAAERGFTVPRELAWYGPVLNPAWAPLTGNNRTHRTQRLAFAVGAGQWLVSRREEYAERGGVRLDTLRPFLQSIGLYHRKHASLAEDVAVRWRLPAGQPPLPTLGPAGPLLVATKVEGVYRLGPDYRAQEALVLRNAEVTAAARARQRRGRR